MRPSKIVAGLEPKETNILLQTIAKCIDKKIDTKNYVAQLHSTPKNTKKPSTRKPQREASVTRSNLKSKSDTTPKSSDRSHNNKTKEKKTVKEEEPPKEPHESETKEVTEEVVTNDATKVVVDTLKKVEASQDLSGFSNARQSSAGLVRPKSARPKSGELKTASTSGNLCFFALLPN